MKRKLQYIHDQDGNISSVIVPYEEWLKIEELYQQLKEQSWEEVLDKANSEKALEERSLRMLDELVSKK
ncbi:hypothetical protein [Algivirga pacifica]|uniref:Prevent-host-death family protein n=1 Tax=Algivirga pacifica TaxID=1162670 RepID=A0ABP9CYA7_9BACT